jgi:hypothetical protein
LAPLLGRQRVRAQKHRVQLTISRPIDPEIDDFSINANVILGHRRKGNPRVQRSSPWILNERSNPDRPSGAITLRGSYLGWRRRRDPIEQAEIPSEIANVFSRLWFIGLFARHRHLTDLLISQPH